jgi:transcriptional activator protein UGA3
MIELFDGASSHWKLHLDGARRLLSAVDRRPNGPQVTAFTTFYRQLYHYLDSATTISTCHPPLLELAHGSSKQDSSSPASSPREDVDDEESLYGVPKSLFHFVDKINSLAYQRKFRDDPIFENMFQASATRLEEELCQWSQDRNLQEPTTGSSEDVSVKYATIAFEQALQLRLHQVVNGYSIDHEKVGHCVGCILDSIQEIRYGSPLESSLTFPLVMAGSSCSTESERMIVRDRFLIMERTLGFRYIYTAHELVQRVWKQRDSGLSTDDVNWAAIRYFQIPGLALI